MGKILESLKRRDPAHGTAGEVIRREMEPTPPNSSEAQDDETVPYIEVGAGIENGVRMHAAPSTNPVAVPRPAPAPSAASAVGVAFRLPLESHSAPLAMMDGIDPALVVWREPNGEAAERYRKAAVALASELALARAQTLALVSIGFGDDRVIGAINLALALTQGGKRRILLIDADGHHRRVAAALNVANSPGWTELLAGANPAQSIQETGYHRLHVVAAGNRLAAANTAIYGERQRQILHNLRRQYDLVLALAPAWTEFGGSLVLAHAADAACLLLDSRCGGESADTKTVEAVQRDGVRLIGSILI